MRDFLNTFKKLVGLSASSNPIYFETSKSQSRMTKKALLVYSCNHFDPEHDSETRRMAHTSAGNLARNIYQALLDDFDVFYIDGFKEVADIPDVDLIVGIVSPNLLAAFSNQAQAEKVLFLVNCHPLFREKVLKHESMALEKELPNRELLDSRSFTKLFDVADSTLLIGNQTVKDTFSEFGSDANKITLINGGVNFDKLQPDLSLRPSDKLRVVYPGSDLGIRKGLFRIIKLWEALGNEVYNRLELVILGKSHSYASEVKSFAENHDNVEYLGWIDSTEKKYLDILQSSHIVLGPSIEEGQVGAVLEAMSCACIPVMTNQCGINIEDQQDGFVVDSFGDTGVIISLLKKLVADEELVQNMSENSREYIEKNHNWDDFKNSLKKLVAKYDERVN